MSFLIISRNSDENRQRLIESNSLRSIIRRLEDSQLSSIAIPVIYNICADYGIIYQWGIDEFRLTVEQILLSGPPEPTV